MSIDLMIRMGLVNVLIKLLDLKTKGLGETHESSILKKKNLKRRLSEGSDNNVDAMTNQYKMKIDFSSPRIIPVSSYCNNVFFYI